MAKTPNGGAAQQNITGGVGGGGVPTGISGGLGFPNGTISANTINSVMGTNGTFSFQPQGNILSTVRVEYAIGDGISFSLPTHTLNVDGTKMLSLSDIHKMLPHIKGTVTCLSPVTHVLGLLLINGITKINIDSGGPVDKIMNKYLGTQDILAAQDELIDVGYKDHARL